MFATLLKPTWNNREKRVSAVNKSYGLQGSGRSKDVKDVLHVKGAVDQPQGGQLRPEGFIVSDLQRRRDVLKHQAADAFRRRNRLEVSQQL